MLGIGRSGMIDAAGSQNSVARAVQHRFASTGARSRGVLEPVPMKRNHCAAQLAAPSPRLPSGRLRSSPSKTGVNALSSATGYGEGRGEGTSPQAPARGGGPSPAPPLPSPAGGGGKGGGDLSPQAGRGKEAAASISSESALVLAQKVAKTPTEMPKWPEIARNSVPSFLPACNLP